MIRTVRQPFPVAGDNLWSGLSRSPSQQRDHPATLPLESRALTRFGRHELALAELLPNGTPTSIRYVARTLHHEIGHRIDRAISGDNHLDGRTRGTLFSNSAAFLEAIRQDLHDAGWRPGQPAAPGFRVWSHLLPQPDATGRLNWSAPPRRSSPTFTPAVSRPPSITRATLPQPIGRISASSAGQAGSSTGRSPLSRARPLCRSIPIPATIPPARSPSLLTVRKPHTAVVSPGRGFFGPYP